LTDPENTEYAERKRLRIEKENEKFDDEHYLADLYDDNEIIESTLLEYKPYYYDSNQEEVEYVNADIDTLNKLPRKTYMLNAGQKFIAFSGLVDILFAYCYNNRVNCGEKNSESGWTIAKLSSTLSWFDVRNRKIFVILFLSHIFNERFFFYNKLDIL
jgi:protein SHQ1